MQDLQAQLAQARGLIDELTQRIAYSQQEAALHSVNARAADALVGRLNEQLTQVTLERDAAVKRIAEFVKDVPDKA
ncbi:MAG: hypothetical protein HC933_14240 [Pleurocapsa sp. SU_196_0]|nr:hypothetical protein [Pleurocapsa sp. SU_196_0]